MRGKGVKMRVVIVVQDEHVILGRAEAEFTAEQIEKYINEADPDTAAEFQDVLYNACEPAAQVRVGPYVISYDRICGWAIYREAVLMEGGFFSKTSAIDIAKKLVVENE